VAVAEAEPGEVMPPVEGLPGWTALRRDAFRAFHRAHFGGLDGPSRTVMFAITSGGDVVGMVRMARRDEPHTMATGMWLGRSARGQGIAVAALRALLAEAGRVGARVVVAETTPGNAAAMGVLRGCGARLRQDNGAVRAEIALDR
jgi:RimJ/RimL family protein N-acetyltransferase